MENVNISEILNKWFEMKLKTYDKLEYEDSIYLYYEDQKYAEIRIDKNSKYIFYNWKLYEEFSQIIPLEHLEFDKLMNKWVEDTFGLKGFTPDVTLIRRSLWLKIPK